MYIYYNPNPGGRHTGDCVARAIAKALDLPWLTVYDILTAHGRDMFDWPDNNLVWRSFLKQAGFRRRVVPDTCPDCYTVADFAVDHPEGTYILATGYHSVSGDHVVTVVNGDWYDSWDSGNEIPLYYWEA